MAFVTFSGNIHSLAFVFSSVNILAMALATGFENVHARMAIAMVPA